MSRFFALLSSVAIVAFAAPAWADTAPAVDEEATTPGEIIVTGEKSTRTLQQTPTSIAVVTPERIEKEALITIQDVYNRTANLSETYGAAGFTIRGVSNTGVGAGGQADAASVYVDGAPIPHWALYGGPTDMWDVQQVEVLRGPNRRFRASMRWRAASSSPARTPPSSTGRAMPACCGRNMMTAPFQARWAARSSRTNSACAFRPSGAPIAA
ncbi:TonB-dependent Receptor Plug Domain protein [Sphingomonas haloaromaticamans]|uniref:TonB-dependent Receptor Plug Domain protein n=1 Tax=Edaphosphingomonas haloaromaticamans TaxID=653954 RepID=A0A1S1HE08_9SPHN|nr:TonB-dependent Receptor Plug Domain protein [Sphingomonas haloaromaticamans]